MTDAVEQHYRDSVARVYNRIGLSGLPERDPHLHEVPLERVFVTLNVQVNLPAADFIRERAKRAGREPEDQPALLEQALARLEPVTLSVAEALHCYAQRLLRK